MTDRSPRPAARGSGAPFWDGVADRYARAPIRDVAGYERTLERTRSHLARDHRVLEIGCGTGTTALRLADAAGRILASDASGNMIAIAQRKALDAGVENVTFVRSDLFGERLDEGAPYDVVLAFNLLHLVEETDAALARVRELVRPGGLFVSKTVILGDGGLVFRVLVPLMRAIGKAPFVRFLRAAAFEEAVRRAGFVFLETDKSPKGPKLLFIVARRPDGPGR